MAIIGSRKFDVTQVDVASVRLHGVAPSRWHVEDVAAPFSFSGRLGCDDCTTEGADGFQDLTLTFDIQQLVGALGAVPNGQCLMLRLGGRLQDGTQIEGDDVVRIVNRDTR